MNEVYKKQVALLLDILPEIAEEKDFVLHGGTAINLFHLNMPRLSVDIDYGAFPAIRWKLLNIRKLKEKDPQKYQEQIALLQQSLH